MLLLKLAECYFSAKRSRARSPLEEAVVSLGVLCYYNGYFFGDY